MEKKKNRTTITPEEDFHTSLATKRWMTEHNSYHELLLNAHSCAEMETPPRSHQWWPTSEEAEQYIDWYNKALTLYDQTFAHDSTNILALLQKGRLFLLFEQEEQAKETFQLALEASLRLRETDLCRAKAFLFQGDALRFLGKHEEALYAYNQAIQTAPNDPDAYVNKGWLLFMLLKNDALEAYDQALALSPDNPDIYYRKGLLLSDMRHYEEALYNFEQAIRLAPTYLYYDAKIFVLYYLERGSEVSGVLHEAKRLTGKECQ